VSAEKRAEFRRLHHGSEPLLLPNAWDVASALALADAGFAAVATTSLGVAAAAGRPDATGSTLAETLRLARTAERISCPFSIDLEGGFGSEPAGVADVAERVAEAGVAGINLEDGRQDGTLADLDRQAEIIQAVKERVPDLFVNARTDAFWLKVDNPLETALARISVFAQAGADGVFVPAIADEADIRAVVGRSTVPVNVLYLPGGHTVAALGELGVRRVSLGSLPFRAALHATVQTARAVAAGEAVEGGIPGYDDIVQLIGEG
jgi:2-methylisocitrate lyase-like PEP mutase family enzyme